MAGIGFELRRYLRRETYAEVTTGYVLAAVIGSGPWLVSIGSMLVIGMLTRVAGGDDRIATQFSATVTHLMAASLVASGAFQFLFVRFVADRIFEKDPRAVAPNTLGALVVVSAASGVLGTVAAGAFDAPLAVRALLVVAFATLNAVWLLSVLLSGLKYHRAVVGVFAGGYGACVLGALALARFGLGGYLASFCLGQGAMVAAMLVLVARAYPSDRGVAFDFLDRRLVFPDLVVTGVLFNAAVWVDKVLFWVNPVTSEPVLGPVRYSVVYDVPIFLAYLSVVPGMAVFLVRIETDFAEAYARFYDAVREGRTLRQLERLRGDLVIAARAGVYDLFCVQGLAVAFLLVAAPDVLRLFHLPAFYAPLFKVDVVAVSLQVVVLAVCTVLFYLDERGLVLALCAFFAVSNAALTLVSQALGPRFYGFGFAVAAGATSLVGIYALSRRLDRLEYKTFMR
jgi:polysaccharide biosynthesis protein PelG